MSDNDAQVITVDFGARSKDCAKEMRRIFRDALAAAMAEGWSERDAAFHLAEAADDHVLAIYQHGDEGGVLA